MMESYIGSISFALLGALFLGFGIAVFRKNRRVDKNGIRTVASIVDYVSKESQHNNKQHTLHFPVLRFIDAAGNEVTLEHNVGASFKLTRDRVPIYYSVEDDIYDLEIKEKSSQQILPLIFIIFGAIFLIIALLRVFFNTFLKTIT